MPYCTNRGIWMRNSGLAQHGQGSQRSTETHFTRLLSILSSNLTMWGGQSNNSGGVGNGTLLVNGRSGIKLRGEERMTLGQARHFILFAQQSSIQGVTLGATPAQDDFCVFGHFNGHRLICRRFELAPWMDRPSVGELAVWQPLNCPRFVWRSKDEAAPLRSDFPTLNPIRT